MDGSRRYYAKWNKPVTGEILHDFLCMVYKLVKIIEVGDGLQGMGGARKVDLFLEGLNVVVMQDK